MIKMEVAKDAPPQNEASDSFDSVHFDPPMLTLHKLSLSPRSASRINLARRKNSGKPAFSPCRFLPLTERPTALKLPITVRDLSTQKPNLKFVQ